MNENRKTVIDVFSTPEEGFEILLSLIGHFTAEEKDNIKA